MKHKILGVIQKLHPYEIVKVRLIPENETDIKLLKNYNQDIENYLTFNLDAVEIIEMESPEFVIKRVNPNIGI